MVVKERFSAIFVNYSVFLWLSHVFSSVQFSHSVVSNSLWPHRLQHFRLPCLSPARTACSNSCPLCRWCHPTISSSVVHFSCLQSFPASGSFLRRSQFFASGGKSIGVSASVSVLPIYIQDWNTWSNRQIWLWNKEWSRAKANRVLPREHTGHSTHPLPTVQEKILHMDIIRWSILKSDWLYSLQPMVNKIYTVCKNKTGSWLWPRSLTPYCQIQT